MFGDKVYVANLCSIALFEYSIKHKKELPESAKLASEISDAFDDVLYDIIDSNRFEEEN